MNRAAPGTPASLATTPQARSVYRRLLGYARPHLGMYMLGVLGMVLYAGSDLITINFIRTYLRDVLTRLPTMTNWQIKDITPEAWAKSQRPPLRKAA